MDGEGGVGLADVGEQVAVNEHVDVRLVVEEEPVPLDHEAAGLGGEGVADSRVGYSVLGCWLSAPVVIVRVVVARLVVRMLRARLLVRVVPRHDGCRCPGVLAGEARDVLLVALALGCVDDRAPFGRFRSGYAGEGHAVASATASVRLTVCPVLQEPGGLVNGPRVAGLVPEVLIRQGIHDLVRFRVGTA